MSYSTILYEKEKGTALITFNRPEKRNALNEEMMNEIDMRCMKQKGIRTFQRSS